MVWYSSILSWNGGRASPKRRRKPISWLLPNVGTIPDGARGLFPPGALADPADLPAEPTAPEVAEHE